MFYGELAETGDSIELPDCEYESLLELFRYMYSDEVTLSENNVMGVLYLAKKYMVPSLADKCIEFLEDSVEPSTVFNMLAFAQKYEEKNLVDRCWEVIDKQTEEVVKSDGFVTIERSLLEAIVERDTLAIEEVELFKAVNLWATKKCEEQGLTTDGSEKRRILGERIVKGIRFPVMEQQGFADVVLDSNILTQGETNSVVKFFNSVLGTPVGFPEKKRSGLQHCRRFGSVDYTGIGYPYSNYPDEKDCLSFTVDKDISLLGVTLCGSENNKYSVKVSITNRDQKENHASKSGSFPSVSINSKGSTYYGFNVFFDRPFFLKKNVVYLLEAIINGPNSFSCENGKRYVLCSGVRFNFDTCCSSNNGTDVEGGQFPEILFTL
ncbi:hypothetical protein ACROYT_G008651 [Oculina patagonica]